MLSCSVIQTEPVCAVRVLPARSITRRTRPRCRSILIVVLLEAPAVGSLHRLALPARRPGAFHAEGDVAVGVSIQHGASIGAADCGRVSGRVAGVTAETQIQAARRRTRARAEAISRDCTGFMRISVTPAASARSESIGPV